MIDVTAIMKRGKNKKRKGKKGKGKGKKNKRKPKKKKRLIGTGIDAFWAGETTTDDSQDDDDDENNGGGAARARQHHCKPLGGRIKCCDGFEMSVQVSSTHACQPRNDTGPYTALEVGWPNQLEPALMEFADPLSQVIEGGAPTVYSNVSARIIQDSISWRIEI